MTRACFENAARLIVIGALELTFETIDCPLIRCGL